MHTEIIAIVILAKEDNETTLSFGIEKGHNIKWKNKYKYNNMTSNVTTLKYLPKYILKDGDI